MVFLDAITATGSASNGGGTSGGLDLAQYIHTKKVIKSTPSGYVPQTPVI